MGDDGSGIGNDGGGVGDDSGGEVGDCGGKVGGGDLGDGVDKCGQVGRLSPCKRELFLFLTVHQPWSTNSKLEQGRTHENQIVLLASVLARYLARISAMNYRSHVEIFCMHMITPYTFQSCYQWCW